MAVDSATTIAGFDLAQPPNSGANGKRFEGAANIRHIKSVLQDNLSNIDGPMTASHTELNTLDGATSTLTAANLNQIAGVTLGDVITFDVGTSANNIVQLAAGGVIPAAIPGVKQIVTATQAGVETTSSATYVDTSLAVSITPQSATSTLLLLCFTRAQISANGTLQRILAGTYAIREGSTVRAVSELGATFGANQTDLILTGPILLMAPIASTGTTSRTFTLSHLVADTNELSAVHAGATDSFIVAIEIVTP